MRASRSLSGVLAALLALTAAAAPTVSYSDGVFTLDCTTYSQCASLSAAAFTAGVNASATQVWVNCFSVYSCTNSQIASYSDTTPLVVQCEEVQTCVGATITCPARATCSIACGDSDGACDDLTIVMPTNALFTSPLQFWEVSPPPTGIPNFVDTDGNVLVHYYAYQSRAFFCQANQKQWYCPKTQTCVPNYVDSFAVYSGECGPPPMCSPATAGPVELPGSKRKRSLP